MLIPSTIILMLCIVLQRVPEMTVANLQTIQESSVPLLGPFSLWHRWMQRWFASGDLASFHAGFISLLIIRSPILTLRDSQSKINDAAINFSDHYLGVAYGENPSALVMFQMRHDLTLTSNMRSTISLRRPPASASPAVWPFFEMSSKPGR